MSAGTVAVVTTDDTDVEACGLFETAIVHAVFGDPQPDLADPWYDLAFVPMSRLDDLVRADTVIVPSVAGAVIAGGAAPDPGLTEALRAASAAGARMVSLCTGAFALAEAGLLDGRRATSHWCHTAELAKRYPRVDVDDSVLYVDAGDVLTGAGMTAGLDLYLHVVRDDLGAHVANQLARRMVLSTHRPGDQAQTVDLPVPARDDDGVGPALDWAARHLDQPLTVGDLARRAAMSSRTFHRRVRAVTGTTPLQWLHHQRLARARALLETTDLPIERIGEHSGLGSAANLRRHFALHVGTTPTAYRRAFGPRSTGSV